MAVAKSEKEQIPMEKKVDNGRMRKDTHWTGGTSLKEVLSCWEEVLLEVKEGEIYRHVLAVIEKPLIEEVLKRTGGNQLQAAKILGMNRNTLHSHIKKLGIAVEKYHKFS